MLPAPDLDDRRFQDLVDDAKRMIALSLPEWSDHNVSDPGITLIEAFAFMVDELLYRLNRVPDRLYVAFLDLLGVRLHPPTAATVDLTLWLSAPQPDTVTVKRGTEASTRRTSDDEAVVFQTLRELVIPPRMLAQLAAQSAGAEPEARTATLRGDAPSDVFGTPPRPGDALLLGLDDSAPSCAVAFRFDCEVRGVGVDPRYPPLVWEAWTGAGWAACELVKDETGGLNQAGDVVLLLPEAHVASVIGGQRAGWLRCRVIEPSHDYPFYSASPVLNSVRAATVGGTVPGVHAREIMDEVLGLSEGVAGQSFPLAHSPVLSSAGGFVVQVAGGAGWDDWAEVDSFAGSTDADRVISVDHASGIIWFPPAVREADGSVRGYGAVPPKGSPLRVTSYRVGGGPRGNVAAGAVSVLRSTVPFVARVENRRAAQGGVAGETIDEAKVRGPLALRTRDRAVTAEDYEQLARHSSHGIARVRCVPASSVDDANAVRLLVVPAAAVDQLGRLRFEDLVPDPELLATIGAEIDLRRTIGARVVVEPPFYRGVTVVARVTARPRTDTDEVQRAALGALYGLFDPITGGADGKGWPFGRPVNSGDAYSVLQAVPGVDSIEEVLLFAADPISGKRGEPVSRVPLESSALIFSFEHRVRVDAGA